MKNRQLDLKVGQEVIIADINDRVRRLRNSEGINLDNIDKWTNKGVITKLGRKLITVKKGNLEYKYDKERNYKETDKYGDADSILYLSIEEIKEEWECKYLFNKIRDRLSGYGDKYNEFTLDQLKRIKEIIDESNEQQ